MEFKAVPRTISDTLELRRKYIIPRFQRDYAWEIEELSALWEDILDSFIIKNNVLSPSEYFIGSLVLVGDDDDNMNIERQVVDGQQRLMTITIAFAALFDIFNEINEMKLADKIYAYIVGEDADGIEYTKLVTETPKPFFQMRIQNRKKDETILPKTDEEKRILYTYNFFRKQLSEKNLISEVKAKYSNTVNLKYVDLLKLFRDQIFHCKVIYVTVKSFDDAYEIFEVLNSKGKDLEPLDIIKNSLFSLLDETEPIDWADEQWKSLRKNIPSPNSIPTFYRHFWLSKYSYCTSKNLVKEFNSRIAKEQTSYTAFLKEIVVASSDYSKIVVPNKNDWNQPGQISIYMALEAFEIFNITQLRIFLLALFDVDRKKLISHKQLIRVVRFLEYFHFIFNAICSARPSGLERRYSSYARKLRECKNKNETKLCIDELLKVLEESLPTLEQFKAKFKNVSYTSYDTKDKKIVQYILKRYERINMKTQELQPLSFTIEHIMPESTKNKLCGRVGNLLPLGETLNSELNNKPFAEKMKRYPESHYTSVIAFCKMYKDLKDWTETMIEERTDLIANELYYNREI